MSAEPVSLKTLLPKNAAEMPLDGLLALCEQHARVERGEPASEAEILALEQELEVTLPHDYREFLKGAGSLRVLGSEQSVFGELRVFGVSAVRSMHRRYRQLIMRGKEKGWLDPEPDEDEELREAQAHERARLMADLGLEAAHVEGLAGSELDMMRIAYRFMVPIMADRMDECLHHVIECVGPGGQLYSVCIKESLIEAPRGTFTSRLSQNILNLDVDVS